MSYGKSFILTLLAGMATSANAQMMERELGDFSLRLSTTPSRSMAQGLVKPIGLGTFHGGLDLSHANGWYLGQWSPSIGVAHSSALEVDSYMGYMRPLEADQNMGYEVGLIHYNFPELDARDRHEVYAGLTFPGSRIGAAWSLASGRSDSTVLLDLGLLHPLNLDMSVKYANHVLDQPVYFSGGSVRTFNDWSLNVSRPWGGARLGLTYSGASLTGDSCAAYSGQNSRCDETLTFKIEHPLF